MTPQEKLELLLDRIAEALIVSEYVDTTKVTDSQKFILNGQLQQGGGVGVLALFQKDIKANQEDLINSATVIVDESNVQQNLQEIANNLIPAQYSINVSTEGIISISTESESYNGFDLTPLLTTIDTNEDGTSTVLNPVNVSQFIPLSQQQSNVDIDKANEFLDTNIFELLPTGDTRQARIIRFFQELNALLPPSIDDSDWDSDNDGRVNREPGTDNWEGANQYNQDNSISYAQDNQDGNIDEEDAFIHRLKDTANDTNSSKTIEDIYNTILPYLTDILEEPISLGDDRPKYRNQSSGYLQFRNPNQGIIIRNTNQEFIEGLDPSNLSYLDTLNTDGIVTTNGTGFTITMWVRFLDKVSEGTLFNFGNPIRGVNKEGDTADDDAFGFRLETFVINKDDLCPKVEYNTWGDAADALTNYNPDLFNNSNTSRFVRLVVNDNGQLRDSHLGCNGDFQKLNTSIAVLGSTDGRVDRLLTTTHIPEDFNEWYFICASFNPNIDEDGSHDTNTSWSEQSPDYWLNHIEPDTENFIANSGYGNKCKVEIISKTDLLRARGFKV